MARYFVSPSLFLIVAVSVGCQSDTSSPSYSSTSTPQAVEPTKPGLLQSIQQQLNSATDYVQSVSPGTDELKSMTSDEVKKLFQVEYKVQDLSSSLPQADFEKELSNLGLDGWECFSVSTVGDTTRVVCKRRPKSVLRYLKTVPLF